MVIAERLICKENKKEDKQKLEKYFRHTYSHSNKKKNTGNCFLTYKFQDKKN